MFRADSAHGIHPSKLSPLEGYRRRFQRRRTHMPFLPPVHTRNRVAHRNDGPRLLGRYPFESPWRAGPLLANRLLDAPLGFSPSRAHRRRPCPKFPPTSSRVLFLLPRLQADVLAGTPEYRSVFTWLRPQAAGTTLIGFLHRCRSQSFEHSESRAMRSPCAASCITADRRHAWEFQPPCLSRRELPAVPNTSDPYVAKET